jgi:heme exporter protein C
VALRLLLFAWIAAAMVLGFAWAGTAPVLEETTRVIYFHVPSAWVAVLALGWSMLHSALYLARRRMGHDDHAASAAELGILFCIGATVSGSLWAKAQWGSYWNWDPRETTIFFLLLVYAAYLALRGAVEGAERRARLAAVYSIVAFVAVPFLVFVVPRIYATLHPSPIIQPGPGEGMGPRVRTVFLAMLAGFTALFFWLLSLKVRVLRLERRPEEAS